MWGNFSNAGKMFEGLRGPKQESGRGMGKFFLNFRVFVKYKNRIGSTQFSIDFIQSEFVLILTGLPGINRFRAEVQAVIHFTC